MSNDFYHSSILPYSAIIIKICRAYTDSQEDFEDYYQEICIQIWRSRENFKNNSKWSTWIYMISLNVCLTLLKKKKRIQQSFSIKGDIADDYEENTYFCHLYEAIKKLPEVDRAVILLYLEEKSYQEIAEIIGSNANNIGVRITRIKERLKKLLHGKIY